MGGYSFSNVDCDEVSGSVTPSQMLLKSELQFLNTDLPSSSDGDNSSVASMNDGCESHLSSWDSEPETDIPSLINSDMLEISVQSITLEENYLDMEEQNQFVGVESSDDGLLWEMDNRSYDDLLKTFMEKEDELRFSNFRLQLLEQENIDLKVLVENGDVQLDNVSKESKLKEEDLHKQKELSEEEIFKLKSQIEKSENRLNNVNGELNRKELQLKTQKELYKKTRLYFKNLLKTVNERLKLKEEELNKQKELSEEETFKMKTLIEKSEIQLNNVNEELKLKEEELNVQKVLLDEEIFKLKIQIEKSENQLDNVQEKLNLKQEEVQKQIAELNTHIPEFVHKISNLVEQLNIAHENLKTSKDEIASLRMELESKSSETNLLQGQLKVTQKNMAKSELELVSERKQNQVLGDLVKMYEANETNHEQEVRKLKSEMLDLQAKFSFDIASLSTKKIGLTSKLEDCESRNKKLENKLRQYEAEKLKQEELYATRQKSFEDEIEQSLMEEQRMEMVMIELEKANNMVDYLKAEICSRDHKISNVKKYTDDVKTSLKELMAAYDTALNEENNLKLRVVELEKEVTRQNGVISNMADEKKEAIRQLCCSLEHYKSKLEHYKNGYNELLRTLYG